MERFAEVWANIMAKVQEVLSVIFAVFEGLGDLTGGEDAE